MHGGTDARRGRGSSHHRGAHVEPELERAHHLRNDLRGLQAPSQRRAQARGLRHRQPAVSRGISGSTVGLRRRVVSGVG